MPITLGNDPASSVPTPGATKNTLFFDANLLKGKDDAGVVTIYGPGVVQSVDVSGGTTGLTTSGGPIDSGNPSGTITIAGTLVPANGGTGLTTFTTGDIVYASATNTLAALPIGSTNQNLTVVAGVPQWTDAGSTEIPFNFGDATPKNLILVPSNSIITSVSIILLTAFDDPTSTLSVGDAGDVNRLLATTDNSTQVTGTYTTEPAYKYLSSTQITLSITPGTSTMGNGVVIINYQ